ncbi:MAG: nuclear transport factor 2 family protein [Pyrinomonadaceae bacterium]
MVKYFTLSLFLILAFSISGFGQRSASSAAALAKANEKEVKETFDRLVEGINQVDVDKVMSVYNNDEKTLFFNYNGSATIGWQNMYDNRKSSYQDRKNTMLEITGLRIEILSPTSAYVSCKWKQTQEFKGEVDQSTGRMTLVFKKFGKDWKVLHLHTSPDTFPSAVVIPASEKDGN